MAIAIDPDLAALVIGPFGAVRGILLAAMPTGINAYVFATYYNRGVSVSNSTILISTAAAALTISFWLLVLG